MKSDSEPRLRPFPQSLEPWLRFLPRYFLDWLELNGDPGLPREDGRAAEAIRFWQGKKVALVKQSAYGLLYQLGGHGSWETKVLSCPSHLGPFSFLHELQADYWIVRQDSAPETRAWAGKYSKDPNPKKSLARQQDFIESWEGSPAGRQAVGVDEVDWSRYDLVVGLDIPIPERLTRGCPQTVWAYYSIEAGGPLQKQSLHGPMAGYDLFLNHGFRRFRGRPRNRRHVLEFPFSFQSRKAWDQLASKACPNTVRDEGVLVEGASWDEEARNDPFAHKLAAADARTYVQAMRSHRLALRASEKTRWGNWVAEAVQAGCLFLGTPGSLAQSSLLLPGLVCRNLQDGIKLAGILRSNPALSEKKRVLQARLGEWLCFERPLLELTARIKSLRT